MQLNIYYVAILSITLSAIFNLIILYITKKYSFKKFSLLDEKRLVNKNTPPLGGVASATAFFISVNFLGDVDYNFIIIGAFSLLISILGSIDDFFNLSWKIKLFFQAEDGIRDRSPSRGLGDVYKRQMLGIVTPM